MPSRVATRRADSGMASRATDWPARRWFRAFNVVTRQVCPQNRRRSQSRADVCAGRIIVAPQPSQSRGSVSITLSVETG